MKIIGLDKCKMLNYILYCFLEMEAMLLIGLM